MPARKARGAIVEKGEKRRKVIGDYLNNLQYTKTNVGAGLPAMTMAQSTSLLTDTPPSRTSPAPTGSCVALKPYFLALAFAPRWRWASNRQTPVATETLRLLTLPAIGKCTR